MQDVLLIYTNSIYYGLAKRIKEELDSKNTRKI